MRAKSTMLTEYAVEPVGVATQRPSACTVVRWCSSPAQNISHTPVRWWRELLTEEFEQADIWTRPTVDHKVVQNFEALNGAR